MNRHLPSALLALALPLANATADAIKLKSGEVVEGKVIASDAKSVTVEVQFSPTITDERTIARSDIAATVLVSPDEAAFASIRALEIPATALDVRAYDEVLNKDLRPFLKSYPTSTRVTDVKELIKNFEAERARVAAGEIKVSGVWYDAATRTAEEYQIDAATELAAMKLQLAAQNYPGAVNSFEQLVRSFPNSAAFAESFPLGKKAILKLEQQLSFTIGNLPQTLARRQAAIDRTPVEQRQPIQAAAAAEDARAAAAAEAAQKANVHFFAILPYDEKGLRSMQEALKSLVDQLKPVDEKQLAAGAKLVRQVNNELSTNQLAAAQTTLTQLSTAWPQYEGLGRLQSRLSAAQQSTATATAREANHLKAQGK
ncbi:MAG TPA: PTPDL family protein [Chthoniobacterales bacterium]|jgi:hypothetical protein